MGSIKYRATTDTMFATTDVTWEGGLPLEGRLEGSVLHRSAESVRLRRSRPTLTNTYCMYLCMVTTESRVWINRVRLPILIVVS